MWVENRLDELRIGAKDQSNSEIARTPRNSFRASLGIVYCRWSTNWARVATAVPNPNKLRITNICFPGVRQWGISFIAEREITQITN